MNRARGNRGKDHLSAARRSWNMSRIRGKHTTPEMRVRSFLHRLGYRFRLHKRIPIAPSPHPSPPVGEKVSAGRLRGKSRSVCPDLILPQHRLAIFVHGCFWHRHRGCKNCTTPTRRRNWWLAKLNGNAARDQLQQRALRKFGWRTMVIWECEIEKPKARNRIIRRLRG